MKNSVGQIVPTGEGFGIEWNGTMASSPMAVSIKTQWVGGSPLEEQQFSVSPSGVLPPSPSIDLTKIILISGVAIGAVVIIGGAYYLTRKKST